MATVYNWHERFREGGVASLADDQRSGRPQSATPEYYQTLEQVLESKPSKFGYDFTTWTIPHLLAHMQKVTEISLSDDTLRSVLARHNYVYRRPKHDLRHLQNPVDRQEAEEWLALLKTSQSRRNPTTLCGRKHPDFAPSSAQVLDETGQTTLYPGGGSTETAHLFAAYDYVTGQVFCLDANAKNSDAFSEMLIGIPARKIVPG